MGRLRDPIYSSVNRQIYGPTYQIRALTPSPSTFIGELSLMNVIVYIRQFHITDE
jgi:hypothetical protein